MRPLSLALLLTLAMAPSAAGQTLVNSASVTKLTADAAVARSARNRSSARVQSRRRDSLWNGIAIGAALGVLATFTTAAEAPTDGKVLIIVGSALGGAWVDARLDVNSAPSPRSDRPVRPRLAAFYRVRF